MKAASVDHNVKDQNSIGSKSCALSGFLPKVYIFLQLSHSLFYFSRSFSFSFSNKMSKYEIFLRMISPQIDCKV